ESYDQVLDIRAVVLAIIAKSGGRRLFGLTLGAAFKYGGVDFKFTRLDDFRAFFFRDDRKPVTRYEIAYKVLGGIISSQNVFAGLGALLSHAFFYVFGAFINKAIPKCHQNKDHN